MITLIPANYWEGKNTIGLPYPWITPETIHFLDQHLRPGDKILEHGAGGSTLFFAKHGCKVYSIETDTNWIKAIKESEHFREDLIDIHRATVIEDIPGTVAALPDQEFNWILIDGKGDRSKVANAAIPKLKKKGLLIFDNYGRISRPKRKGAFSALAKQFKLVKEFNDEHWHGRGTALYQVV